MAEIGRLLGWSESKARNLVYRALAELRERGVDVGEAFEFPFGEAHNLTNALCAVAIGREVGISSSLLADSLAAFEPAPGRTQLRRIGPWTVIDDTYNASPTAFAAALEALDAMIEFSHARPIVIAGDML